MLFIQNVGALIVTWCLKMNEFGFYVTSIQDTSKSPDRLKGMPKSKWLWRMQLMEQRIGGLREEECICGPKPECEWIFKKNYNASVVFLVFFMFTESMASWDWIMALDPHWFSTLFGWYVASLGSSFVQNYIIIPFFCHRNPWSG